MNALDLIRKAKPTVPPPGLLIAESVENPNVDVFSIAVSGEPTDSTTPVRKDFGSQSEEASDSFKDTSASHDMALNSASDSILDDLDVVAKPEAVLECPDAVSRHDCWGGCIHFYHRGNVWECRTLDGNYDLGAADIQCPKLLAGYRAPLPDGYIPPLPVRRAGV